MAEWRNGGMAEWRTEWQNGGMVEWRNGGMAEWRNGGMAKMADGMADGMEEWRNGGMAEWRNGGNGGRMAEWSNGGNGYLPTIFMVHADDDEDDDDDTDTFKSFIVLTYWLYLEEPISSGYPAQPGLIGESVSLSVCPIRLRSCSTNIVIDATAPQT
jgi:hypothetical protein